MHDSRQSRLARRLAREPFGLDGKSICVSAVIRRGDPRGSVDQTGLVERASQGDHEAFGVFAGAHGQRVSSRSARL
jgi:hypothetical protein